MLTPMLKDSAAWISGGASGIGLAVARRLAREGVRLALVDRDGEALARVEGELRAEGATVLSLTVDVSRGDEVAAAAARARETFGVVSIIFNNAGIGGAAGPSWLLSEDDWRRAIDVNLWGVIHGIRHVLRPLIESGEPGHIINTASIAGLTSPPGVAPYVATKHAVVALTETLSKELELTRSKVRASVLCPGFVKTNITSAATAPSADDHPLAHKVAMSFEHLVANGIPAETIADMIVDVLHNPRFYILTHEALMPAIEHRMRDILENRTPGMDPKTRAFLTS
jgi:NAD(P)-dependent dehydrogenase (short-subunit alcohol dehydrogenase family)